MARIGIVLIALTSAIAGVFTGTLLQSGANATHSAQVSTNLFRLADNNTPDGTETQDPEQQEQQTENQQQCGNANGCG